jgi:hypothetical protein
MDSSLLVVVLALLALVHLVSVHALERRALAQRQLDVWLYLELWRSTMVTGCLSCSPFPPSPPPPDEQPQEDFRSDS